MGKDAKPAEEKTVRLSGMNVTCMKLSHSLLQDLPALCGHMQADVAGRFHSTYFLESLSVWNVCIKIWLIIQ